MTTPLTCPACGASLRDEDRFCPACGKPVVTVNAAPPPLPQTQPIPVIRRTPNPPDAPVNIPPNVPANIPPDVPVNIPPAPPAVNSSAIPPTPITLPAAERVIDVVGMVRRKTGLFSSILYHLVITDKRLIFAHQTTEMQKNDVNQAREVARQQGKGFFGQVGAQMSTRYGDKYMGMTPPLILSENPDNFAINHDQVVKISVFHGDFEDNTPDSMEIKTVTEKHKFTISNAYNVEKQLKQVLGSKVK